MKIWSTPYSDIGVTGTITVKYLLGCCKTWLYAGTSEYPAVLVNVWPDVGTQTLAVKIRPVRTISRKPGKGSSETTRRAR
jgi:hypothetical protein